MAESAEKSGVLANTVAYISRAGSQTKDGKDIDCNSDERRGPEDVEQTNFPDRRQLGLWSAIFLNFNRMVGTGIFATPSSVLRLSGSVGLSLVIWILGILITFSGAFVFLEFGTGLPRNGGEKNYLEYVFTRPRFLVTCMYAGYVLLVGWAGANSIVFGGYILHAADVEVTRWNQRGIGLACITAAFLIHGCALKWGLRLQNLLGVIKLVILITIAITGFVVLGGHVELDEKPDSFTNVFEGTTASAYGTVTALYNVIWCLLGYNNANYALSEIKNPIKTIKIALPVSLVLVSILYMLVNIAFFAAIPRHEIVSSGRILAASFFRNVMGEQAERALSVFVALSAFGNVLSIIFSQGRLVQEIGREGFLPLSSFFASSKPFNTPFSGLFEHWLVCVVMMIAPPPGDAYSFILNVISYPMAIINAAVAIALIVLYIQPFSASRNPQQWAPPVRATLPVAIFFLLSNIFLIAAPYVPPSAGQNVYKTLPYWLHCVVGLGIFALGALYWVVWAKILPSIGRYELVKEKVVGYDGWTSHVFLKKPKSP
ncbi:hypothetical protein PZA11_005598 [Diplocarpon coronariae]|uniref:High affinity methionine permease n=1 Tax=Diplocarpon coronariae TaxID=2795749 RepID=A0A218Z8A7_9HELO|nr:hypothetical protein B2J93_9395 [Marssonina coronariae]